MDRHYDKDFYEKELKRLNKNDKTVTCILLGVYVALFIVIQLVKKDNDDTLLLETVLSLSLAPPLLLLFVGLLMGYYLQNRLKKDTGTVFTETDNEYIYKTPLCFRTKILEKSRVKSSVVCKEDGTNKVTLRMYIKTGTMQKVVGTEESKALSFNLIEKEPSKIDMEVQQ